jgi:hypothetical protein
MDILSLSFFGLGVGWIGLLIYAIVLLVRGFLV